MQLFYVPEKTSQECPLFLEIMPSFLEFSHLKPNQTVKSRIVTLYMTFERILKDFEGSNLSKTQVLPIAFVQVPTISQLYQNERNLHLAKKDHVHGALKPTSTSCR